MRFVRIVVGDSTRACPSNWMFAAGAGCVLASTLGWRCLDLAQHLRHIYLLYFLRYFLKQNRDPDRKVFHHVTCATDTANVQVVMDSTRAMIIQDSLNF